MTREGNGDMEADEFPRKRMRQPCAVYNSHTWEAGAEVPGGVPGGTASAGCSRHLDVFICPVSQCLLQWHLIYDY